MTQLDDQAAATLLQHWTCPDCGTFARFKLGPRALDTSVNVFCECGAAFNVTPSAFRVERIGERLTRGKG